MEFYTNEEFENQFVILEIGELGKVVTGATPSKKDSSYWDNGTFPWITTPDFKNNIFVEDSEKKLTEKGKEKSRIVPKNSLLVTCIGEIGKVVISKVELATNQQINTIITNDKINFKYFYYLIKNNKKHIQFYSDVNVVPMINKSNFLKIPFKIHKSLKEQTAIAEVLTAQEDLIQLLKEKLNLSEKKAKFLQQELLSGRYRIDENGVIYKNKDFKTVVVNGRESVIPEDWEVDKIVNKVNFIKGKAVAEKDLNRDNLGHTYLKTTELWLDSASKRETLYYDGDVEDKHLKKEDEYVFSLDGFNSKVGKGTLGLVSNEGVGIVSTSFYKIEKNNYYEYVINILKSDKLQNFIINLGEGTTVKHAGKYLKTLEYMFPNNDEEMINISNLFKAEEETQRILKKQIKEEEKKMKFLSQELLSGRIRING